ncbi:glycosyltransferase [Pseudomonadales bacterium]|nr:glycosyltransferase [Pseudomonadales bacterium]
MFNNVFRQILLPRILYLPWFTTYICANILGALRIITERKRRVATKVPSICIEAGELGWESIEFKELYQSSCEYFGEENVMRLVVDARSDYVTQVRSILANNRPTHYLYDPRTGSQEWWVGYIQSTKIALLLVRYNVTPIVLLTDLSVRLWRMQSAIVSAARGVVVSFMAATVVHPIFPHNRLLGPCLMPFSKATNEMLNGLARSRVPNSEARAIFTGSLYEPRTSTLNQIEEGVRKRGGRFELLGRSVGTTRVGDQEYWRRLVDADIVFTTSVQMYQPGTDWVHIPHFLYRYLEVLASGSLLIAEDVPAVRRYFEPGVHFIKYESVEDAIVKILFYEENASERKRITQQGKEKAESLINARTFWMLIDASLGKDGIH